MVACCLAVLSLHPRLGNGPHGWRVAELALSVLEGPLPSMLALSANNRKCPCHRPFDPYWDHVKTCRHYLATWTQGNDYIQSCVVTLFREAGYTATTRGVAMDISTVPDFHGSADNLSENGTLHHQDIDLALSQREPEKVEKYREGYAAPGLRHAFLPAIVFTSVTGRIHGELLRLGILLFILADKKTALSLQSMGETVDVNSAE